MTRTSTLVPGEEFARRDIEVPAEVLDQVHDLYLRGLTLQAYEAAREVGPLKNWVGAEARLLAGRLAVNLGAPRLALWHHTRAYREAPTHPEVLYYYARRLLERRGPLAAWEFLRSAGELPETARAAVQADWLALHGMILALLRDFDAAERWLARAEALAPDRPWIAIERSFLLEREDRPEEALASARRALELRPWYRPAVQSAAHLLQQLDRDSEALELLEAADALLESGPVVAQLVALYDELGRFADIRRACDRYAVLSPLLERNGAKWLAAQRADAAYHLGESTTAATFARHTEDPFYMRIAERLDAGTERRRVLLDVGFVRQHHQTCAPATLTALSRYWNRPVDHLELAAEICYDGTPDHRERLWAEQNGYVAREFTVNWESATALLDRGVPFTLTTVEPTSAHLQAVIGYDALRGSLIVRDPTLRQSSEMIVDRLLERYRSTGPRGMAMVPADQTNRLEGIDLPDTVLYDQFYRLRRALWDHDRDQAAEAARAIEKAAPGHRLSFIARRALALYDADRVTLLACLEELLRLYPGDSLWEYQKLGCLRELATRDDRLAFLQPICERKDFDPVFLRPFAQELAADARQHDRALRLLNRSIRLRPLDDGGFAALARIRAEHREFDRALELCWFAACLSDKDEGHARSCFSYARYLKRTDEVLGFLRKRFDRLGRASSAPARTLFDALVEADRVAEAFAVLDEALRLRPDDGELLLFAADAHGRHGEFDRSRSFLARAEGRTARPWWLRTAASLTQWQGDLPGALALWRDVAAAEPLASDAHRAITQLLAETAGREAALVHLRQVCQRFPHHILLHQLLNEWLRDDGPTATEPVIRQLIAIHPADAWSRRELALCLADQRRLDEAFNELVVAQSLEPDSAAFHSVHGQLCLRAGRMDEAKDAFRKALAINVDDDYAFGQLMECCDTLAERREVLAFVGSELVRQVTFGEGLLAFQRHAQNVLEPDELLGRLREALAERPDLWHAHAALVRQLIADGHLDEARERAEAAANRFPMLPRIWLDLAAVHRARVEVADEAEAIDRALRLSPGWGAAVRHRADLHERQGQLEEARAVLEAAIVRAPLDPLNHGWLAETLWKLDRPEEAIDQLKQALALEPGYDWAWNTLREWSAERGQPEAAIEVARALTRSRPGEARSWLTLARLLPLSESGDGKERLDALDRALALNPHLVEARDLKAEHLATLNRFDEARAVCADTGRVPLILRGRSAWVEARRGDLDQAIALMRQAVADDPDYYWGWKNLADWCETAGRPVEEVLEAAEGMVHSAPRYASSHGYRGEALMKLGRRQEAKDDFRQALELAPDYNFAALSLFDLCLEDGELEEAAALLQGLEANMGGAFVQARAVQLAARTGDRQAGLANLVALCQSEDPATWPLQAAYHAALKSSWGKEMAEVLNEAVNDAAARPRVGWIWANYQLWRGNWDCWKQFGPLVDRGAIGREALSGFLEVAGRVHALPSLKRWWLLRRLLRRYGEVIRGDTLCWGNALFALATWPNYRTAARWGSDWDKRPIEELQPWMLINVALSLRAVGRDAEAQAVSRRALELDGDYTTRYHEIWLAFDDARNGDGVEADRVLARYRDGQGTMDATNRFLFALVEVMRDVQRAETAERGRAWSRARRALAAAALASSPLREDRPAVRHASSLAVRRLGRDANRPDALLWSWLRQIWPPLPRRSTSGRLT